MKFCKIIDAECGQVLILKSECDDGNPEIQVHFTPSEKLGVCVMKLGYEDDEWERMDECFDKINLQRVMGIISPVTEMIGDL